MDRSELRFRILFECYDAFHSPPKENDTDIISQRIYKIDIPDHELNAAMTWLIDYRLVEGNVIQAANRVMPIIARINSRGMDYVEYVMDKAFTEIKGESEDFDKLSKTDKIATFAKDCLKSTTTGSICQVTLEAIVTSMLNLQPPS